MADQDDDVIEDESDDELDDIIALASIVSARTDRNRVPLYYEKSPNSYYNRSKFHSIVLQGICDDQNRFIDVYIGFPGSAHDARILKESPVFEDAEAGVRSSKAALPTWKTTYNMKHGQQRVTIENTFGLLKQRFQRMYLVDSASIRQCCLVVMGACRSRDFFDDLNNARPPDQVTNDDDHAILPDDATRRGSERIREAIAKTEC
ncbi:hypothetical protein HPB47_015132 [Ixodes persulcatus]|uniref:Uncharacterized protein n=1 Tax=Ixodes persulcatus TaxID=34615 RepID=A0AC60QXU4_IXOPE|nr:hypothetical protein HPB47_015132 [Ixodes persulcatus]